MVERGRLDRLEITGPIRLVEREAVLQQLDATQVKGALDARSADRQARLLRTETWLHHHARRPTEQVALRAGLTAHPLLGPDDGGTTWDAAEFLCGRSGGGGGQRRITLGGNLDGLRRFRWWRGSGSILGAESGGAERERGDQDGKTDVARGHGMDGHVSLRGNGVGR